MKIIKVSLLVAVLVLSCLPASSMTVLSYTKNNFTVEFQQRPWSLPTSKANPANLARLRLLTKKYSILVWNDITGVLTVAKDGDDMNALIDDTRAEIKTIQGDDVPKYIPGKTKIRNGKIVP